MRLLWSYLAPFLRYGDLLAENCEFFLPHSHLRPSFLVNPFEFLDELFIAKTGVLVLSVGDFVILTCVVLTQCQRMTNRQTDGRTTRSQLIQSSDIVLHSKLCWEDTRTRPKRTPSWARQRLRTKNFGLKA